MNRHAYLPPHPVKPISYRTRRTVWQRLRPIAIAVMLGLGVALLMVGVASAIARMHATDAQLDAAFLRGMSAGQLMCRSN